MNKKKLLLKALSGSRNIPFDEMTSLVQAFGFVLARVNGSHHIFSHPGVNELLNLQDVGGEAKPHQIKQFLRIVERHGLEMEE